MSWKPQVKTGNDPKWYGNGLAFATQDEAVANAAALALKWTAVADFQAAESDEPVNYAWVNGALVPVTK